MRVYKFKGIYLSQNIPTSAILTASHGKRSKIANDYR